MTNPQQPLLVALERDGASVRITLSDGGVYVASNPRELWDDISALLEGPPPTRHALGDAMRNGAAEGSEYVDAEVVDEDAADAFDHHGADSGMLNRENLEGVVTEAGEVLEEYCRQEWGTLGQMFAEGVRRNGRQIHNAISPRARAKSRKRARRRRS